jgi:NitT/TauT family transport system substrate-binding protein
VSNAIYSFYASKGYKMSADTFAKALSTVDVNPGFPHDLGPYMTHHAEVLLKTKKISKIPDWKTALRTDFMDKAKAGS